MKWDIENLYLFLKDLRRNDAEMEFKECLGQFQLREKWGRQWTVTKIWGKNWKSVKNCLWNAKHAFFAIGESRQQVAWASPQNTQSPKLWKKFLSVFCDWKVYPQGSRKLSCENLSVPLATGPFIHEQVAKTNLQPRNCSMRLRWPTTKSPK